MTEITIDRIAEQLVHEAAAAITAPADGECLACFVARMLADFRCDRTLRFARTFRDRSAPLATTMIGQLAAVGSCCDCEIFRYGWSPHPSLWSPAVTEVEGGVTYRTGPEPPDRLPRCAQARPGSMQPCRLWVRRTP